MPSTSIFAASAVLALSGMAAAFPQAAPYGISNNTIAATGTGAAKASGVAMSTGSVRANATTSSAGAKATGDALFCPNLNGDIYLDHLKISYLIGCGTNHFGTTFEIDVSISGYNKRAVTGATSLADCLDVCDTTSTCVGTAFNTADSTCTYFSDVQAPYADAGVDFATRVNTADASTTTVAPGDLTTSTVFTTSLSTILSCAATVTNCPLRGSVVTDTLVAYTTVCPATAGAVVTAAASPVACTSCPYSAGTATVYTTTVETVLSCASTVTNCPLTTTVVPVTTVAVNYPVATGTDVETTGAVTVTSTLASGSTVTKTSGLVSFTGAADNLKAGMGMAAVMVGAVFMI